MSDLVIRYAETDHDTIAIHKFLLAVAAPTLPGPVDAVKSIEEVWRVCNHSIAIMAMRGDVLVGTLGLVNPDYWWNPKIRFLANRWFFTVPASRAGKPLLKEAKAIAVASGFELHIYDESKGRLLIFNRSKLRPPRQARA